MSPAQQTDCEQVAYWCSHSDATRSGRIDGVLDIVLTLSMKALGQAAVQAMVAAAETPWQESTAKILLPIVIYSSENP